jgi:CDP-glucose 4,6-dehydratase
MELKREFWRGRRVLVTGHTGFKGAWLALWLESLGAQVTAVSLPPAAGPSLFEALRPWHHLTSISGDLRDPELPLRALAGAAPELVFHLAAQALVRRSYSDAAGTFATNVLGTAHLLEAVRRTPSVKAALVVTSDKVYENSGDGRPFREGDPLGGSDPYSASKACQAIVAASYERSFLRAASIQLGSARAGNVIGGGDWAADRLIPDFIRSMIAGKAVTIRQPDATRPWQHVLDALAGYLIYAERLFAGADVPRALNFGPDAASVRTVRWVIDRLAQLWGDGPGWKAAAAEPFPEARALTLDASLAAASLGWRPRLALDDALAWTVEWYRAGLGRGDMRAFSLEQIRRYEALWR